VTTQLTETLLSLAYNLRWAWHTPTTDLFHALAPDIWASTHSGLGVLAGDHLKASSDLGVPLMGIGLLYRYGYFRQSIDATSRQQEHYDRLDPEAVPLRLVSAAEGLPLEIEVPFAERTVWACVWLERVQHSIKVLGGTIQRVPHGDRVCRPDLPPPCAPWS
jgi:glucan phosphorylase